MRWIHGHLNKAFREGNTHLNPVHRKRLPGFFLEYKRPKQVKHLAAMEPSSRIYKDNMVMWPRTGGNLRRRNSKK